MLFRPSGVQQGFHGGAHNLADRERAGGAAPCPGPGSCAAAGGAAGHRRGCSRVAAHLPDVPHGMTGRHVAANAQHVQPVYDRVQQCRDCWQRATRMYIGITLTIKYVVPTADLWMLQWTMHTLVEHGHLRSKYWSAGAPS